MESRLSRLTPRERQILRLAIQGLSNRDTGSALGISEKTVENHKSSIFKRIGFENTADVRETLERLRIKA